MLIPWRVPIGCMGRLYVSLHLLNHKKSTIHVGKYYQSPMDPMFFFPQQLTGGIQKQPTGNHHYLNPIGPSPGPR